MTKSRVFRVCCGLVLLTGILLLGAGYYLCDLALRRSDWNGLGQMGAGFAQTMSGKHWLAGQEPEEWRITSADGLRLHGYYLPAAGESARTVLLAHGYHDKPYGMGVLARFYHGMGYNVLLPSARAHYKSEGNFIGFGWLERGDLLRWLEELRGRGSEDLQVVLHGVSMGGASVLMLSGEELPTCVEAIIDDCGYSTVWDELAHQLRCQYGLPAFPLLYIASGWAWWRAGYTFGEASALAQVAKSRTPTLFIHGRLDDYVPYEMVEHLYAACAAPKELYVVEGAGHAQAYDADPVAYEMVVREFLARHMSN